MAWGFGLLVYRISMNAFSLATGIDNGGNSLCTGIKLDNAVYTYLNTRHCNAIDCLVKPCAPNRVTY
jgi:hypothetical protein